MVPRPGVRAIPLKYSFDTPNPQQDFKTQELPLARIKKIMKMDEDVKVNMVHCLTTHVTRAYTFRTMYMYITN